MIWSAAASGIPRDAAFESNAGPLAGVFCFKDYPERFSA